MSTTKSAAASRSSGWPGRAIRARASASGHAPVRASRSSRTSSGASTTSTRRRRPEVVLHEQRDVVHQDRVRAARPGRRALAPRGWMIAFEVRAGGPGRRTPAGRAGPGPAPSARSTSVAELLHHRGQPGVPGATTSRATASASMTTAPRPASTPRDVVLPGPDPAGEPDPQSAASPGHGQLRANGRNSARPGRPRSVGAGPRTRRSELDCSPPVELLAQGGERLVGGERAAPAAGASPASVGVGRASEEYVDASPRPRRRPRPRPSAPRRPASCAPRSGPAPRRTAAPTRPAAPRSPGSHSLVSGSKPSGYW